MSRQLATELASKLPANLHYLSTLIARKPEECTREWATTVDEAFSLYTRTSTVNLILSWNNILAEMGWPFPSYLNLRKEVDFAGNLLSLRRQFILFVFTGKGFL
jgi:hypothetical protein